MKRILLSIFVLIITSLLSWGQIISQYTETNSGTSPKGIEIWNNTASSFDFSVNNLVIEQGTNGGAPSALHTINSGTLAVGEVIVIGTSDMEATATTNGAAFSLRTFQFNGDDALVVKYGGVTTDIFGEPGNDPGSSWSGSGVSTANQNIQLKTGITTGASTAWTDPSTRFETVDVGTVLTGFGIPPASPGGPTITVDPLSLSGFNYDVGNGPSAHQTFAVSGSNLTNHITITPPANFEISLDGIDYFLTYGYITLLISGGNVSETTIYTRLKSGLNIGSYTGDISVGSIGATSKSVACAGYVEGAQFATLPYNNDFSSGFDDVNTYDAGGPAAWSAGSGYASINGFPNDNGVDEDWMILPGVDFSSYSDVELSFDMWWRYGNQDASNYLELYYSTNYNGYGDPSAASWTEISFTVPSSDQTWTSSGIIDLSSIIASNVNIAFKYSSDNAARQWQIDNILLQEDAPAPPPPPVVLPNAWINEFHYDNDGPDVDEMVEIVIENAGDYTLANFTLSLYNGNNGAVYVAHTLDGFTLGSTEGNYSVFYKNIPNIQNGAPDGFSLDYEGDLIQFISYEGDFVAAGGPADGVNSADIGISQSSSSAVGYSLQLIGSGFEYSDFNWVLIPETAGLMNTNQFFGDPLPVVPVDWRYILAAFMLLGVTVVYRKLR
jgi:hypothetical protein